MSYYISNPIVNLGEKFIMSFDWASTNILDDNLFIGVDPTNNKINPEQDFENDMDLFFNNIQRGVRIAPNTTKLSDYSPTYRIEDNCVVRKDGSTSELLGLKLQIIDKKVYEEVKDVSTYNAERDMMFICVRDGKLFKHIPEKYEFDEDSGKIKRKNLDFTTLQAFENGQVTKELFIFHDSSEDHEKFLRGKIRFVVSNFGKTLEISKKVGDFYEKLGTFFFSTEIPNAYIYAGCDSPSHETTCFDNLSINYSKI